LVHLILEQLMVNIFAACNSRLIAKHRVFIQNIICLLLSTVKLLQYSYIVSFHSVVYVSTNRIIPFNHLIKIRTIELSLLTVSFVVLCHCCQKLLFLLNQQVSQSIKLSLDLIMVFSVWIRQVFQVFSTLLFFVH
jgi:hypothetical protein